MASVVSPSMLATGFLGLVLSKDTPVFDIVGLPLQPFLWLTGLAGGTASAGAIASGLAEMFLPGLRLKDADLGVCYLAAVPSVSSVILQQHALYAGHANPMRHWPIAGHLVSADRFDHRGRQVGVALDPGSGLAGRSG